jgi:hypothetical protein
MPWQCPQIPPWVLAQPLHYSEDGSKLLDSDNNAVMMSWEGPLMIKHAEVMCPTEGKDVLNIGFGLGLIDTAVRDVHFPPIILRSSYTTRMHNSCKPRSQELTQSWRRILTFITTC